MSRTPFEKNYNLLHIFFSSLLGIGLFIRLNPKTWSSYCWGSAERDVLWYCAGPLAFYREGS